MQGDAPATATEAPVDWWFSIVTGLVEGLTEFIPVSSTGHIIVTSRFFGRDDPAFEIGIQMGAITAILFLYWPRVFGAVRDVLAQGPREDGRPVNLIWLLFMAAVPASVLGLAFNKYIDALLFNNLTVAITLIVGGIAFLFLERWQRLHGITEETALGSLEMTPRQALQIGLFQCLALIPGMSRSGATIAGGMLLGFKRTAAAEFSFLVGLPILYGAALVKIREHTEILTDQVLLTEFLVASVAAFLSAFVVVKPFVRFLQRHTFVPFGWYRIVAGIAILLLIHYGFLSGPS